ncbi:hypothetical protein [Deinococcus cellulosilyticus]|uniref:Uncharacterized protein n=1 Tax=Deinococcus cellulosilyticus (strain DSM 18568 / NBRC 106333 / KACC 11606 / 5516J-15) TaxID=1223518 RepID=A0A511MZ81_DEIC1|nr:hypothetical protein [Deinococcus cellulosilyticus]GEM45925.1 hypothetical protein DC3_15600 [Deinococcus cellulosilyticus NBRC 106333 = KACC 11606]
MESNWAAWFGSLGLFLTVFALTAYTIRDFLMGSVMRWWRMIACLIYIGIALVVEPPPPFKALLTQQEYGWWPAVRTWAFGIWFFLTLRDSQIRLSQTRKTDPPLNPAQLWQRK